MGVYLNPGNEKFKIDTSAKIYVDKTGMIAYCNVVLATPQRFICVSRPRRFGKSVAANMQEFASQSQSMKDMLGLVRRSVLWDLLKVCYQCYAVS